MDTFANNLSPEKCNTPLCNNAKVLLPVCPDLLQDIPKFVLLLKGFKSKFVSFS